MIDQNQEVTIHASCTRPVLLLGCDRTWFFGSLLVCVLVAASSQSWWGPPLAIAMWCGAIKICRMIAQKDPKMRLVWRRAKNYRSFYPAKSGLWSAGLGTPLRWRERRYVPE
jgi:type IV secretion system protein TrbD